MTRSIIEEINIPTSVTGLFSAFKDRPYPFFLDSSCDYEKLGRFSFLGSDPFLVFRSKRDSILLEWQDGRTEDFKSDPFCALKEIFKKYTMESGSPMPFTSGAVGYFSYDLKDFVEKLPDRGVDDIGLPDCILGFYDVVITRDNLTGKTYIASSGLPEKDPAVNACRRIERLKEFEEIIIHATEYRKPAAVKPPILRSNFSREEYGRIVEKAKAYIKKGDIYQVNLSQRFEADIDASPSELYLILREVSPAPFSSYLDFGDAAVASSSPERFLMKNGSYIETRPIKGTRPRGRDLLSDSRLSLELAASRKDRAEHIMIVDLERNDLGKICEYGSVRPTESFIIEKYANVFHLVSTVAGSLKEGVDAIDCLRAAFPGGSITGAPKIRSMEIIEELEPLKRSIYTGAIGYISFDGNMDTSIVIRTFIMKKGRVYFQVGGGIVADSVPDEEYEETIDKARGLLGALGVNLSPEVAA